MACALASIYGFLQGAWPFGLVEAVWAGVAIKRWRKRTGGGLKWQEKRGNRAA